MSTEFIDLSHIIEDGTKTYKGLPAPVICDYWSREESRKLYDDGSEFQIGKIEMVANTGTYIDSPFHRFPDGKDLSELDLDNLAGLKGIAVHAPFENGLAIGRDYLKSIRTQHDAVLIHTGWDRHWGTESYFDNHPFLTEDAAQFLKDSGVKLVGIDSHNIDDTRRRSRPVHTSLLGSGILIVEHLCNLDKLPDEGFTFCAVAPKFKGVGTFPVRAYAQISKS